MFSSVHSWILLWPGFCLSHFNRPRHLMHACNPKAANCNRTPSQTYEVQHPRNMFWICQIQEAPFSLRRWLGQFSGSISTDPRVPGINPLSASQVSSPHLPSSCLLDFMVVISPSSGGFFWGWKKPFKHRNFDESKSSPNLQVAPKKCFRFW